MIGKILIAFGIGIGCLSTFGYGKSGTFFYLNRTFLISIFSCGIVIERALDYDALTVYFSIGIRLIGNDH